jgi:hypothetical protein
MARAKRRRRAKAPNKDFLSDHDHSYCIDTYSPLLMEGYPGRCFAFYKMTIKSALFAVAGAAISVIFP